MLERDSQTIPNCRQSVWAVLQNRYPQMVLRLLLAEILITCFGPRGGCSLMCPENGEWLCETHVTDHSMQKFSRFHRVLSLEALAKCGGCDPSICNSHSQLLDAFCETCDMAICHLCALSRSHHAHDIEVLADVADKHISILRRSLYQSEKVLVDQINPAICAIEETSRKIEDSELRITARINQYADFMLAKVEEWRGGLRRQLEETSKQKKHLLHTQKIDLNEHATEIRRLLQKTQEMFGRKDKEALLAMKHDLCTQIDEATNVLFHVQQSLDSLCR